MDALSPVAERIPAEHLGGVVARERLLTVLSDRPVTELADALIVGRAVGLSMSEMQRLTGMSRQTLYRHIDRRGAVARHPPRHQAQIEVLILLAAAGPGTFVSHAELARLAAADPLAVMVAMNELGDDRLCAIRKEAYSGLEAALNPKGERELRSHFDELHLRRPESTVVFLLVPEGERAALAAAAADVLEEHGYAVLSPEVAPSMMVGPELALAVHAPTTRRAIEIALQVWHEVRERAGLEEKEAKIMNVIPPGGHASVQSAVLDAYVEAAVDSGALRADTLRGLRAGFNGGASEKDLAGRCVTSAAVALRRLARDQGQLRTVRDGDSAFVELQHATRASVDPAAEPIKKAVIGALELAAERIGPFPGGRLGSFRRPGAAPRIVDRVAATGEELRAMGELAGRAVGAADALGAIDAVDALTDIVSGRAR